MCDPTAGMMIGASTALQVGGQAAGFLGQRQQAKAAAEFQNERYLRTARAAEANFNRAVSMTARQQQEMKDSASQQALVSRLQALAGSAQASAAFGTTGNTGVSASMLYRDFERQAADNRNNIRTNLSGDLQSSFDRLEEFRAENQSRINAALPQPVSSPSMLAALLGMGATAAGGFSDYLTLPD